jgi:hypothetical protein
MLTIKNITRLAFFIILQLLCLNLSSQKAPLPEIKKTNIGIYAGPNLSQLLSDNYKDTKARIGYQYGAYIQHGKRFFLRSELAIYSMSSKIYSIDTNLIKPNIQDVVDLQFVHIPSQFGINIFKAPAKIIVIWISGGAYLEQIFNISENDLNLDFEDFNSFSYGLLGTAGVDIGILSMQLSYQQGKRPIFKKDDQSQKYTIALSFGLKF